MDLAEKLCEDILLINRGAVVSSGKLAEIKKNFGGNNVRISFNGNNDSLNQFSEIIKFDYYKNFTEVQLKDDVIPSEFLKRLVNKIDVNHFSVVEPTLNKIFIDLIKENSDSV